MRLLDLALGVGPDSEAVGAWLDAHPRAAGIALLALLLAYGALCGALS